MRGLRIVLKGLSDTLEHLLPFVFLSLGWWLAVFLIVPAPAATVVLFRLTDPRIGVEKERPDLGGTLKLVRQELKRGWALTLMTLPVLATLVANLAFYASRDTSLAFLLPLWVVLFVVALVTTLAAFSCAGLFDLSARSAVRQGFFLTGARLPRALVVIILLWLLAVIGTALVVPAFMFLPATIAASANRFVLNALDIPIVDPLTPTDERLQEEERTRKTSRFGP